MKHSSLKSPYIRNVKNRIKVGDQKSQVTINRRNNETSTGLLKDKGIKEDIK